MRIHRKPSYLKAKGEGYRRNQSCWHLDYKLPACSIAEKYIIDKATHLWSFIITAIIHQGPSCCEGTRCRNIFPTRGLE